MYWYEANSFLIMKCDQWKAKLFGKEVTFHRYQQAFGALECLGMPWNVLECLGCRSQHHLPCWHHIAPHLTPDT